MRAYVLDSEVVAISYQAGRKYAEEFYWVSRDAYNRVKDYCQSFALKGEGQISIIDDDEFDSDGYSIEFCGQIIKEYHGKAKYNGKTVKVIGDANPKNCISSCVIIQFENGSTEEIDIINLRFPYHFLKESE